MTTQRGPTSRYDDGRSFAWMAKLFLCWSVKTLTVCSDGTESLELKMDIYLAVWLQEGGCVCMFVWVLVYVACASRCSWDSGQIKNLRESIVCDTFKSFKAPHINSCYWCGCLVWVNPFVHAATGAVYCTGGCVHERVNVLFLSPGFVTFLTHIFMQWWIEASGVANLDASWS